MIQSTVPLIFIDPIERPVIQMAKISLVLNTIRDVCLLMEADDGGIDKTTKRIEVYIDELRIETLEDVR